MFINKLSIIISVLIFGNVPLFAEKTLQREAIEAFKTKIAVNAIRFNGDPYAELNGKENTQQFIENIGNKVCAIKYLDDNIQYELKTFDSKQEAFFSGYIVTHFGNCGTCSTLRDLATYLEHQNLTTPVRRCSLMVFFKKRTLSCLQKLGFTKSCAETWYYNAKNTAKECLWSCAKSWYFNEPFNLADGKLNSCLACDERESGPIFKYVAGRTRRNSGIQSAIKRDTTEIYHIQHDYY